MRAKLDRVRAIHHDDQVGHAHGGEAVRYQDRGAVPGLGEADGTLDALKNQYVLGFSEWTCCAKRAGVIVSPSMGAQVNAGRIT